MDGIISLGVLITGVVWTYNSVQYIKQWGDSPGVSFGLSHVMWIGAFAIIFLIHALYALTSIKRTKFSKTTLVLVFGGPLLIIISVYLISLLSSREVAGYILWGIFIMAGDYSGVSVIFIIEGILILLHLAAFIYDCVKARRNQALFSSK